MTKGYVTILYTLQKLFRGAQCTVMKWREMARHTASACACGGRQTPRDTSASVSVVSGSKVQLRTSYR
jgi:hypothetical protein